MARQGSRLRGRVWPIIGFIAVLVLWGVSAAANFEAGQALATGEMQAFVLGTASIFIDVMKAIAVFIVAAAFFNKRWVACGIGLVLLVLCSSWSLRAAGQFAFTALSDYGDHQERAEKLKKSNYDLLDLATQHAQFSSQQTVKIEKRSDRAFRKDALAANRASSDDFHATIGLIKKQQFEIENAKPVPPGDAIAGLIGAAPKLWTKVLAAVFALLLELVSCFGPWLIVTSRTPKGAVAKIEITPPRIEAPKIEAQALPEPPPPARPPPAPVKPEPDKKPVPPPAISNSEKVVPIRPKAQAKDPLRAIVGDLFEAHPSERSVYGEVAKQINAQLPNHERIMAPQDYAKTILPAILAEFPGVERKKVGGRTYLYGLRPKSLETKEKIA
jgi:hypothetical protein